MSEQNMQEDFKGDLMVNNLIYRQPKALSLAVNRTMRRQNFQRSTYTAGETAICVLNTGSDYLKTCNSYLVFSLASVGGTANFGSGSAVNVIQNIIIRSRSGTELDRIDNLALWSKNDTRHTFSTDWVTKYGSMTGSGLTGIAGTDAANVTTTARRFVLPLSMLSGLFRPVGGQLMPPVMAAGLEISITFVDYRTALFQKTGTVTNYNISGISLMADCVTLADDTQKTLNVESSQTGLEYTYPRVHTATGTISSTSISQQVQKAVAQASVITATLRTQSNLLDVTVDSLASDSWNVSEWNFRVGSLYFPSEQLRTATDGIESFFIAQQVYDKAKHGFSENSVSLLDFTTNGYGVMSASFERDQSLNLSGLPINNSRSCELVATLASWAVNLELTIFLEYVAVARCYIDNMAVSI